MHIKNIHNGMSRNFSAPANLSLMKHSKRTTNINSTFGLVDVMDPININSKDLININSKDPINNNSKDPVNINSKDPINLYSNTEMQSSLEFTTQTKYKEDFECFDECAWLSDEERVVCEKNAIDEIITSIASDSNIVDPTQQLFLTIIMI